MTNPDLAAIEAAIDGCTLYSTWGIEASGQVTAWDRDDMSRMDEQGSTVMDAAIVVLNSARSLIDEIKRLRAQLATAKAEGAAEALEDIASEFDLTLHWRNRVVHDALNSRAAEIRKGIK